MAEATVDGQTEFHRPGDVFLVIRVGRYFHDNLCADTFQMFHQPQRERVGVVIGTDVHKVDLLSLRILHDRRVVDTFQQLRHRPFAEIGHHLVADHQSPVAERRGGVVAQADIRAALFECLHLVMYLLADSVCFVETVKYQK